MADKVEKIDFPEAGEGIYLRPEHAFVAFGVGKTETKDGEEVDVDEGVKRNASYFLYAELDPISCLKRAALIDMKLPIPDSLKTPDEIEEES